MSKYKWWLHKKEINKIQYNIDSIADQVLEEYPAMVTVSVNGLIMMQGHAMHERESTCLQYYYQLNAGDQIQVIKHNRILCETRIEHAGVHQVFVEAYGNTARIIIDNRDEGIIYESRIAS